VSISGLLPILFSHLAGLRITEVFHAGRSVRVRASTCVPQAACSACGVLARRVHSRYQRRISDTAVPDRELLIHLQVRRFFCGDVACSKKIFSEQVPDLTVRYGRRSVGLAQMLRAVALALGGRAGARLSRRLAAAVSRMTLLRIIRAMPDPAPGGPVRVFGVDDFALRRGHIYGTVLIDITTSRPIDVLPDRSADALAAWLTTHPGVEVICRDRAGSYSDGAARSAPEAIQVADRFHLWRNLGEAVERVVAKHRTCLTAATSPPSTTVPTPAVPSERPARTGRLAERTRERHAAVHALLTQHASLPDIAAELGVSRNTVRRFARATTAEELLVNDGTGRRTKLLDSHADYLRRRWSQGCSDAARLWEELRGRGYRGSYASVRDYVRPLRTDGIPHAPAPAPPKVRQFTGWIMRNPANLDTEDTGRLDAVLAGYP
jgi:transposase